LNDGSFYFNTITGDVLICDNDNVTPGDYQNSGEAKGKPGYMAPEVVTGKAGPSTLTDLYSLAVVLFKLFVLADPLEGKKICEEGITNDYKLKGTNPIFIFDPNDTSNRPIPLTESTEHKNAITIWPLLPCFLQEAFEKAFGPGIKDPNNRVTEYEWQKILVKWRDESIGSVECPECKERELDFIETGAILCEKCGKAFKQPYRISVGDYCMPLLPGKKLYPYHTNSHTDFATVDFAVPAGEVTSKKDDYNIQAIQNLSDDVWTLMTVNGETKKIEKGDVAVIASRMQIIFNGITAGINYTYQLIIGKENILLFPGQKLYAYQTTANNSDKNTITGEVVTGKKEMGLWAIKNLSDDAWTLITKTGENKIIGKGDVVILADGIQLNFNGVIAKLSR
jgi:serine/threonine protein kinase